MSTCVVCCEYEEEDSFIICSYCKFQSCENCNQKFIEDRPREPLCMNCGKIWSREFVLENISDKKWFFRYIGKYILEQEKMLLPETQNEASLVADIKKLTSSLKSLPTNARLKSMYKNNGPDALNKVMEEKSELRSNVISTINFMKSKTITYGVDTPDIVHKRENYIFKCPRDCRGFVSDNYVCGTCKHAVCKKCRVQIDEDSLNHICNEDDIKSSSLIVSLTKPCPKCMTLILKASGCDQMFCVLCHASFSWNTGMIETGIIHNPHYYEYLSTLSSTVQDIEVVACGDIPDAFAFMSKVTRATSSHIFAKKLRDLHRIAIHIRHVIVPSWRVDKVKDNIDIRVQYLLGEFDESLWELKLLNREKKRMKLKAFQDLIHLVLAIVEDFIRRIFILDIYKTEEWHTSSRATIVEVVHLKEYYEKTLRHICKIHGGIVPFELSNFFYIYNNDV